MSAHTCTCDFGSMPLCVLGCFFGSVYAVLKPTQSKRLNLGKEPPFMNRFVHPSFLLSLAVCIMLGGTASATNYYIAANGNDSNNGTSKTTPWLHAPGMPNCKSTCASANPGAGSQIIFRGGDTWHFGNSGASPYVGSGGWVWTYSGSNGNPIYVGVDQTWYSGNSWVRPVLSGDNPLWSGSGFPSSCAFPESGSQVSLSNGGNLSYVTFDNFEFSGFCWTGQAGSNGAMINVPGGDTNCNRLERLFSRLDDDERSIG